MHRDADRVAFLRAASGDDGNLRLSNLPGWRRRLIAIRLRRMVLCRRRGWQRVIDSGFAGNRMIHKMRAIHGQGAAIVTELIAMRAVSGRRGGIPDGDGMDGCVGDSGDVFRINPMVDEVVIMHVEVVDDCGVIVNLRYLRCTDAKAAWVWITKMPDRNECETIHAQTKVESNANVAAPVKKTDAFPIRRKWRQRRPAAVIVRIPPGHP